MKFFDTHAHIGLIYDNPIEQLRVIQQAKQAGVQRIISINNSLHDFEKVYKNIKSVPGIYHAVGVAPSEVTNPGADWIATIEKNLELPNVVAVGETGLDYYKQFGDKRSQIELFITQLEIAQKHNLPVIIHNRDAGKDIFDILSERIPDAGAVLHCYSEDAEYAKKALDLNVYFSLVISYTLYITDIFKGLPVLSITPTFSSNVYIVRYSYLISGRFKSSAKVVPDFNSVLL